MRTIEVRELEKHISEILRQVKENAETIEVAQNGEVIARLTPVQHAAVGDIDWADTDILRAEIAKYWPVSVSAVDAVRDVRREL